MAVCVMKTHAQVRMPACQHTRGLNQYGAAGTPGAVLLKDTYKKSNHSQRKSQGGKRKSEKKAGRTYSELTNPSG